MARHIVCLTLDFDTMSPFIARGLTSPSPLSRGEFGTIGAARLLELFKRYDIVSTWFTPGFTVETYPAHAERVVAAGHEIAHHGWTHRPPATLSREDEETELVRGNAAIRKLTGRNARGYRSPSWDLSPHSIELLIKHGFDYDSSLMGGDYQPYRARLGDVITLEKPAVFGRETDLIEMPITWALDDFPHFEYLRMPTSLQEGSMSARAVEQNWTDEFDYFVGSCDWGILTYTFHPFVIGRGHRMMMLERLIRHMAAQGAAFLSMERALDEWKARQGKTRS
jgi:peptidoglycan/xylan/chitin deacetylase (PgdA/CDA1 family)